MDTNDKQIIAVWDADEDLGAHIFTPDEYAQWAETNHLTDTYANPVSFYRPIGDGTLRRLSHACVCGSYDTNDYADITHTWTDPGVDGITPKNYATAIARRDGRA
ncbi:hypothetical protein [Micromonospora sp. CPCC 206061]|uniref:hypothetical protein n=1 Tax=Micromonospora sp. CPCC 206061 TaxID=3122410 RepID=UPI002FF0B605